MTMVTERVRCQLRGIVLCGISLLFLCANAIAQQINPPGTSAVRPAISADGRYVAYFTFAGGAELYRGEAGLSLYDRETRQTRAIAENVDAISGVGVSGAGNSVVYSGYTQENTRRDIYLYNIFTSQTTLISKLASGATANGSSVDPSISEDGRYVAFRSVATNLTNNDTNGYSDIFFLDTQTNDISRVSIGNTDEQADKLSQFPEVSDNGRFVVFSTGAYNLVDNDTYGGSDVFVRDTLNGTTELASVRPDSATDWGDSFDPSISADGRYVAFLTKLYFPESGLSLWKIYLRDRVNNTTKLINPSIDGNEALKSNYRPIVSANGEVVTFVSESSNLVLNDDNDIPDVFLYEISTGSLKKLPLIENRSYATIYQDSNSSGSLLAYSLESSNRRNASVYIDVQISTEPESPGVCDYSAAQYNDGWGWNSTTGESCAPRGICDYKDAPFNDGWGWNAISSESCPPLEDGCDYTDAPFNEGWGWNSSALTSCPPLNRDTGQ